MCFVRSLYVPSLPAVASIHNKTSNRLMLTCVFAYLLEVRDLPHVHVHAQAQAQALTHAHASDAFGGIRLSQRITHDSSHEAHNSQPKHIIVTIYIASLGGPGGRFAGPCSAAETDRSAPRSYVFCLSLCLSVCLAVCLLVLY